MKNMRFARLLCGVLISGLLVSCMGLEESDPSSLGAPEINTFEVKDNGSLVFELSATVDESVAGRIAECGFYYGKDKSMSGAERIECKMIGSTFSADVTLRDYGETFYVCSYISNGSEGNEICSQVRMVSVQELESYVAFGELAVVSYDRETKVASVNVSYETKEGVDVTARGLCYGTSRDIAVSGDHVKASDISSESVIYDISGIEAGKTYYVRPYLYDGEELAYGGAQELHAYAVPVVDVRDVSEITSDGASFFCEVVDDCGKTIKSRGVVYVKGEAEPTMETGKVSVSGATGEYTVSLSGLSPNTFYSVRAYAENEKGVAYSTKKITFTTSIALPIITVSVGDKTSSSVNLTGKITSDGGEVPSEVGFYYSTSKDVDPAASIKVTGALSGSSFSADVTGLTRTTRYYVCAYAVNSIGESVSSVRTFTTKAELPVVETLSVMDITCLGAVCGGNVTDDGGTEITAKGIVWNTSPDPTVSLNTKTDEGIGAEEFISSMTGLAYSTKYYVRAYATNSAGTSYGEAKEFETDKVNISNVNDLSSGGTANCYVVSKSGINRFPAVKGNSSTSVGSVNSVEVLWESFGTSVVPSVGSLIKSAFYSDGYVLFETASSFREGNAVIAAKATNGTILWSWHIWLTDEPGECVYANNAGTMMDRNLGATSAIPGEVEALGLLYQWGRKDPFLGSSSISSDEEAKSTITWPSPVTSSASHGTKSYTVGHPTTFITRNETNYDWYYTGSSSTDNTRWQLEKTIYDPCPAGWQVPDGGSNSVWNKAGFTEQDYDDTDQGILFGVTVSSPATWYPATGYRAGGSGTLVYVGYYGRYWSFASDSFFAYMLSFERDGLVDTNVSATIRSDGLPVRCIRE